MNLTKLFEAQKELDDRIAVEHPPEAGEDRLAKKILSLQVELGECANEWRGFKFWSKNQKPNGEKHGIYPDGSRVKNPLLEEYVDCLHFILSIGHEIGKQCILDFNFPTFGSNIQLEIVQKFNKLIKYVAMLDDEDGCYQDILDHFGDLGYMLGFTWGQVEAAYFAKNQINHDRQATGY